MSEPGISAADMCVLSLSQVDADALREMLPAFRRTLDQLKADYQHVLPEAEYRQKYKQKGPGDSELLELSGSRKFPQFQESWEQAYVLAEALCAGLPVSQSAIHAVFNSDIQQEMDDWIHVKRDESLTIIAGMREIRLSCKGPGESGLMETTGSGDPLANPFSRVVKQITNCQFYYERISGTIPDQRLLAPNWQEKVGKSTGNSPSNAAHL